ncbi:MAG: PAS domain S-box protein [Xanthobacteraceae bacterium]
MSSHTSPSTVFLALERQSHELLQALPAAIYVTDAAGRITFYNEAAAELWGCRPELGKSEFSDFWKLLSPDGTPLPRDQSSLAVALRDQQPTGSIEAIAERRDGSRILFLAYPTPLFDKTGALTGAVNMLVDITERRRAELDARRLAAIVESSDDAILTKDLNGNIVTWNQGAERLYGYTQDEVVGKPVTLLIPADRHEEEAAILARIRRGERIKHYETIRRRKDGSLVEISLTVSPIKGLDGRIVGASKIARDITEQRLAQERQQLLLREMNHRIKNLFTIASSLVSLSARSATTPRELATDVGARLTALARAHELTLSRIPGGAAPAEVSTTLHALITTIIAPYDDESQSGSSRVTIGGCDLPLSGEAVTSLALLLYEFATNAAKYGALSTPAGRIDIRCSDEGEQFLLTWTERGVPPPVEPRDESEGYGRLLERATVKGQLGGEIARDWAADGLTIRLSLLRERLTG